jgi:hypothetical protein
MGPTQPCPALTQACLSGFGHSVPAPCRTARVFGIMNETRPVKIGAAILLICQSVTHDSAGSNASRSRAASLTRIADARLRSLRKGLSKADQQLGYWSAQTDKEPSEVRPWHGSADILRQLELTLTRTRSTRAYPSLLTPERDLPGQVRPLMVSR